MSRLMSRAAEWVVVAFISAAAFMPMWAHAADEAWKFPVLVMDPPRKSGVDPFAGRVQTYTAPASTEVTKKWNICALFPHTTNDIVRAYIYGAVEEATRLKARLTIFDAGGYGKIDKQIAQFEDCVTLGADAILLFSVSSTGLNQKVEEARKKGIKVVDLLNGVSAPVDARVVVTYQNVGELLGRTLAQKHPKGSGKASVVLLPGPAGVTWAEDTVLGFKKAVQGSDVVVEKVVYGQSSRLDQQSLVEDVLVTYPKLEYLVGMGTSIEAALNTLREQGRVGKVGLYASFVSNDLMPALKKGEVSGAVVENSIIITKLAVDLAVRALERKASITDAVPEVTMADTKNAAQVSEYNFAPAGWKAKLKVD